MQGKYSNYIQYAIAWLAREQLRSRLTGVVEWDPLRKAEPGCTVVIGMCSRLPDVIIANLRCVAASRWPDLKALIVTVDSTALRSGEAIEQAARQLLPDLKVEFFYYSKEQSSLAERLKLPYVYSWLSWCLAIRGVRTEHLLIHDYDALILGTTLEQRYAEFRRSNSKVQGISWYSVNGAEPADRLATTFEQFCDVAWLRSLRPLDLFNKIRLKNQRSIDFDTTLDAQDRLLSESERQVVPMNQDELVHPSQMIHQYTMFRRHPARALPCFSMPMIPFFSHLGGATRAISQATDALESSPHTDVDLFGDGTRVNLHQLDVLQTDWALKQMVQASLKLSIAPHHELYAYGIALYRSARAPEAMYWKGDFTAAQRAWIEAARANVQARYASIAR